MIYIKLAPPSLLREILRNTAKLLFYIFVLYR